MSKRQDKLLHKVNALIARPGTPGEREAAMAARERVLAGGGTKAKPKPKRPTRSVRLTDKLVRAMEAAGREQRIYDLPPSPERMKRGEIFVPGFGVRISAGGARAFILRYLDSTTGKDRVFTIGTFGDWTTDAARAEAQDRRRRFKQEGVDPLEERRAERESATREKL